MTIPDNMPKSFISRGSRKTTLLQLVLLGSIGYAAGGVLSASPVPPSDPGAAFTNPIFVSQDPWITYVKGKYYFSQSGCGNTCGSAGANTIYIKESATLTGLSTAVWNAVWTAPATGPNSTNVWAPELHYINSAWYIYYAATDATGEVSNHRNFVLQAMSGSPLGQYTAGNTGAPNGELVDSTGTYAIDPDVFTATDGALYLTWSCGLPVQSICLAQLSDPLHIHGEAAQISSPSQNWEMRDTPGIQEGPVGFVRNGVNYITYSASNSGVADDYAVGLLVDPASCNQKVNPLLSASSWRKDGPIFDGHDTAYGTGSVVFVKSADDRETWVLYHGIDSTSCIPAYNCRDIRMQKMYWTNAGYPVLGYPVNLNVPLTVPSGEDGYTDETGSNIDTLQANWGWGTAYGDAAEGDNSDGLITAGAFTAFSPSAIDSTALGAGYHQAFMAGNPNLQRYLVSVNLQWVSTGDSSVDRYQKYGVYAAYVDHNNYFWAWIDKNGGVVATQAQVAGVSATDLAGNTGWQNCPIPGGFNYNRPNQLQITANNGNYVISLNGVPVDGPCQNRTFSSLDQNQNPNHGSNGQAGVVTENTTANYTGFSVTPLE
jgi:GH43 family beta-xylosidase